MAIGSVSVEVVPDARGFHRKLTAELRDLEVKVNVNADTARAKAQIDKLGTANRSITINADADTAKAAAKLDELARTRTASIKANVDQASFGRAEAAVGKTAGSMNLLLESAVALAPALIPASAAIAAMAGALAAPIATAGAGAGLFGVLSVAAIAKATKDSKAIAQLRKQADSAADPKRAAALTKAADAMSAALPKSERAFLRAVGSISKGFDVLLRKGNIFQPLAAGASLLGKVLPRLSPITSAFGGAIAHVVTQLSKFSDTHGFRAGVNFIAKEGTTAFRQFIQITKNLGLGVGGLIQAFAPLGTSVLSSIGRATAAFRRFGEAAGSGKSAGFQNFLDYVKRTGPQVGHTLVDVGRAVGKVVLALAPQGSTVLSVIDKLALSVAKLRPGQIASIAVAVGALGIATGKFSGLKGISVLVAGLSYAYNHSKAFHTLADGAGRLASALNNLPDVAKILGGAALVGGALKVRGSGGTGGGVAGTVSRAIGGVQKVFVVNMGKAGIGGVGGTVGGTAGGGKGGRFVGLGGRSLNALGTLAVGSMVVHSTKGEGGRAVGGAATGAIAGGQIAGPAGAIAGGIAGGVLGATTSKDNSNFRFADAASSKNIGKMVASYKELRAERDRLTKGASPDQLKRLLDVPGPVREDTDKMRVLMGKLRKETGLSTKQLLGQSSAVNASSAANRKSLYTFSGLARATSKVGISTQQTAKMFRSLPKTVQTKILTPGALKSKADIRALGKQFGLTPKQIQSIIKLVGARDAIDKTAKTQKGLRKLNTTSARPKVVPQGNEATDNKLNRNIKGFRKLNAQSAKPKVKPQGTGELDAKVARNQSALRKLNASLAKPRVDVQGTAGAVTKIHSVSGALNGVPRNIPVSINIHAYGAAAAIASAHAAANAARQAAGNATGGWIHGPGTGTSDSIPRWLSNGEFVVNAAAAHRNAALLEAINGRGAAPGSHMATGGPVRSSPSVVERTPSGPLYLVLENGDTLTAHLTSVAQGVNGQAKRRGDMNARAGAGRRGA